MSVHYNKQSLLEKAQETGRAGAGQAGGRGGRSPGAVPGDLRGGTVIII